MWDKILKHKSEIILLAGFLGIGGYEGLKPKADADLLHDLQHDMIIVKQEQKVLFDVVETNRKEIDRLRNGR